jgi:flagellar protein FlgJ
MDLKIGTNAIISDTGLVGTDAAAKTAAKAAAEKEARAVGKVAREFESLFVGMMLKSMRNTVGKDKLTSGGRGEEIYRSMLDQEYASAMSEHGGIGLAAMLERQMIKPVNNGAQATGTGDYEKTTAKIEVSHENQ